MKKLLLIIFFTTTAIQFANGDELDSLWFRWTGDIKELDFTPDDNYVIAWTSGIEFWNVESGTLEFVLPNVGLGGYNSDETKIVFAQNGVPKLLDWQTKEIEEGFERAHIDVDRVKPANENQFVIGSNLQQSDNELFIWNTETKQLNNIIKIDSLEVTTDIYTAKHRRLIKGYNFVGDNDDFIYVSVEEQNIYHPSNPEYREWHYWLLYDRVTMEVVDSLTDNIVLRGIKTMNTDRDVVIMNIGNGTLKFFNIRTKEFLDTLRFQDAGYANDFELTEEDGIIGIVNDRNCKLIDLKTRSVIRYYDFGVDFVSFSNFSSYFSLGGGNALTLIKNIQTNVIETTTKSENLKIINQGNTNIIEINLNLPSKQYFNLSLHDLTGKEINIIREGSYSKQDKNISYKIDNLIVGVYFIRLATKGMVYSKQFIKE